MGDPTRLKKKYEVPKKAWEKERIEREKELMKAYGMRRKKELRRMETILRNLKRRARALIGKPNATEERQLIEKAHKMGLVDKEAVLDTILKLSLENVLERRLQTQLFKLGLAKTPRQARQLIVHRHVLVDGEKIISPAYIVQRGEENKISFAAGSSFGRARPAKPAPAASAPAPAATATATAAAATEKSGEGRSVEESAKEQGVKESAKERSVREQSVKKLEGKEEPALQAEGLQADGAGAEGVVG